MLTTEQCIEIATNVWGWEQDTAHKPSEEGLTVWEKPHTQFACWEHDIEKEVNSWQGFGRTVEAMADKAHYQFAVEMRGYIEAFIVGVMTKEELWERTHLAALEAFKDE